MDPKPNHPLMKIFSYQAPTRLVYGINSIDRLKEELKKFEFKNALIVTGSTVCKTTACDKVREALNSIGKYSEFNAVRPEPETSVLAGIAECVRQSPPDLVIGVGGGSALDMAKVASMLVANDKDPIKYFKGEPIVKRGPPIITVPTIAGTGSEVTPITVIVDDNTKMAITHYTLYPAMAIIDPVLSLTVSPQAMASAGIDALCHAIESIMSVDSNPVSSALAFEAISNVDDFFERAYCNGEDIEARNGLSLASVLAGMAFSNTGLCLPHGIAYTYAVQCSLPHGASVSLAEPYVVEFNTPAIPEKIDLIAAALGIDTSCMPASDVGCEVADRITEMLDIAHLPQTLDELNLDESDIEPMVNDLLKKHARFIAKNPRKPSREELIGLYESMF